MVNLSLQSRVLLLAEFQLKLDDLLLLAQIRHERTEFRDLGVGIISGLSFARLCGSRASCLFDASSVRADRLEMLVEETVLVVEVLTPAVKGVFSRHVIRRDVHCTWP